MRVVAEELEGAVRPRAAGLHACGGDVRKVARAASSRRVAVARGANRAFYIYMETVFKPSMETVPGGRAATSDPRDASDRATQPGGLMAGSHSTTDAMSQVMDDRDLVACVARALRDSAIADHASWRPNMRKVFHMCKGSSAYFGFGAVCKLWREAFEATRRIDASLTEATVALWKTQENMERAGGAFDETLVWWYVADVAPPSVLC